VLCRGGASDLDLFKQIFVDHDYRCLDDLRVSPGDWSVRLRLSTIEITNSALVTRRSDEM
jgi:hypothetical protein